MILEVSYIYETKCDQFMLYFYCLTINHIALIWCALLGGTFDVSLLTIEGGVFEVKATAGDTHLGNLFEFYFLPNELFSCWYNLGYVFEFAGGEGT